MVRTLRTRLLNGCGMVKGFFGVREKKEEGWRMQAAIIVLRLVFVVDL
jgi:hypothetical protein